MWGFDWTQELKVTTVVCAVALIAGVSLIVLDFAQVVGRPLGAIGLACLVYAHYVADFADDRKRERRERMAFDMGRESMRLVD